MKKIFLLVVVSFFVGKNCEAQNLVPNPSFEDTSACPWDLTLIDYATGWSSYRVTPDYFNTCSQNPMPDVPRNEWGYQFPATGNAYIGIGTWPAHAFMVDTREVAGSQLLTPLIVGTKYYLSMKVCRAEKYIVATNNIGISFSTIPYNEIDTVPINNASALKASQIITDSMNWVIVKGSFVADSSYQYVMVGNFYDDQHTDTVSILTDTTNLGWLFFASYYYIDDVCVSFDSLACDLNPNGIYNLKEAKASIKLYPNPTTNQLTVESTKAINTIEITDALGRVQSFKSKVQSNSTQIDIHSLASGIYLIKLYFSDGAIEVKKFVKE